MDRAPSRAALSAPCPRNRRRVAPAPRATRDSRLRRGARHRRSHADTRGIRASNWRCLPRTMALRATSSPTAGSRIRATCGSRKRRSKPALCAITMPTRFEHLADARVVDVLSSHHLIRDAVNGGRRRRYRHARIFQGVVGCEHAADGSGHMAVLEHHDCEFDDLVGRSVGAGGLGVDDRGAPDRGARRAQDAGAWCRAGAAPGNPDAPQASRPSLRVLRESTRCCALRLRRGTARRGRPSD